MIAKRNLLLNDKNKDEDIKKAENNSNNELLNRFQ